MGKMKVFLLATAVAAMVFTFSCSSEDGDDKDGGSSSSVEGGGDLSSSSVGGESSSSVTAQESSSSLGGKSSSSGEGGGSSSSVGGGQSSSSVTAQVGTDGTWNASGGRVIILAGNTFNYKVNGTTQYSGIFSISGSTITFNATGLGAASGNIEILGETFTLSNHTWDSSVNGTYTKGSGGGGSSPSGGGSSIASCPNPSVSLNSMSCGGQTYRTVNINGQVWMAENLNYNVEGSRCYGEGGQVSAGWDSDNDIQIWETLSPDKVQANCIQYGRLYDWATARSVCPAGWHLPSDTEWQTLVDFAGGEDIAGTKLRSTTGWNINGTDDYEFSALPGGVGCFGDYSSEGCPNGNFTAIGAEGFWWSATGLGTYAWIRNMLGNAYSNEVDRDPLPKSYLFSVRCVKD